MSFDAVGPVSGSDSDTDGRAVLIEDLDLDGDDDIVLTTLQRRRFLVFRNERTGGAEHGSVQLRLRAKGDNTRGIGALVTVRARVDGRPTRTIRPRMAGDGFASQRGEWMTFGAGASSQVDVEVLWPGGEVATYPALPTRRRYLLVQGDAKARSIDTPAAFSLPDPPPPGLAGVRARPGQAIAKPPLPLTLADDTPDAKSRPAPWEPRGGHATVLHLWATWCKSCKKELPELARLAKELAALSPKVDVQTVSMEPGDEARVARWLSDQGLELPAHVADPQKLSALLNDEGMILPTTLILDRRGRLAEGLQGNLAVTGIRAALARLDSASRP